MNEPRQEPAQSLPAILDHDQDLRPANDLQAAQIRDMASNAADNCQRIAIQMQQDVSEMGRWILASLLAMNTGGAVAIVSASEKVEGPIGPPIVAFALGATFAIGTGINGMVTALRAGPVLGDVIERLRLSIFESTIHAATRQRASDLVRIGRQQLMVSSALAASSLTSFGIGIFAAVT